MQQIDQHREVAATRVQAKFRGNAGRATAGAKQGALERSRAWSAAGMSSEWAGPPPGAFG